MNTVQDNGKIIMVDDDMGNLQSMSLVLEKSGFHVTSCLSGKEALALAGREAFDVALLDMSMPEMNGLELLGSMRRIHPGMGVFFVTGADDINVAREAADRQIEGYFTKPVDQEEMIRRVQQAIADIREKQETLASLSSLRALNSEIEELNIILRNKVLEKRELLDEKNRLLEKKAQLLEVKNYDLAMEIAHRVDAEMRRRESEALLENIIESAPDAVITFDGLGRVTRANEVARDVFRMPDVEEEEMFLETLIPEARKGFQDNPPVIQEESFVKRVNRWSGRSTGRRVSGEVFPLQFSVSRIELETGGYLFTAVLMDITDRVRKQRELEESLKQLKLESEGKDILAGNIAHEAISPAGTVTNLARMAKASVQQQDMEATGRYLTGINKGGERITVLMRQLQAYARQDKVRNEFKMEHLDFCEFLRGFVDEQFKIERDLSGKHVSVRAPVEPMFLWFDPYQMEFVLRNLISNALKFSRDSKEVLVEAGFAVEAGKRSDEMKLSVVDWGGGVPDDEKETIFTRYYQGRTTNRALRRGWGIGLAMVKEVVLNHGGRIWCEDNPDGRGAIFHILLSMKEPEVKERTPAPSSSSDSPADPADR